MDGAPEDRHQLPDWNVFVMRLANAMEKVERNRSERWSGSGTNVVTTIWNPAGSTSPDISNVIVSLETSTLLRSKPLPPP